MSEGLSFTLSLGGVDFCLTPLDPEDDDSSGETKRSGFLTTKASVHGGRAPMVSVTRSAGKSADDAGGGGRRDGSGAGVAGEIVAELSGFSGTLRIALSSASASASASALAPARSKPSAVPPPRDASPLSGGGVDATAGSESTGAAPPPSDGSSAPAAARFAGETSTPIVEDRGSAKQKGPRASKWQSQGRKLRYRSDSLDGGSAGEFSSSEARISSTESSLAIIDEGDSADSVGLGAASATGSLHVSQPDEWKSTIGSEASAYPLRQVSDESDGEAKRSDDGSVSTSASVTAPAARPFQKLLHPASDDTPPPPLSASSPLHGRDRPFKKVGLLAMAVKRRRDAGTDASAKSEEEDGRRVVDDGMTNEGAAGSMSSGRMSGVAFESDSQDNNSVVDTEINLSGDDGCVATVTDTAAINEPFQKLLSSHSMAEEDALPAAPAVSPLHGRDRPFRKIAIATMMTKRRHEEDDANSAAVAGDENGCTVENQATKDGAAKASSKGQISALALRDTFSDDKTSSDVALGAGAGVAPGSAKEVLILGPRVPRIVRSTPLHIACANSNVTLSRLRYILESDPGAAFVKNERGKLPIHIIAENESLLQYQRRREDVGTFIRDLCDVYPTGIITEDDRGNVPLAPIIRHWIQNTYHAVYRNSTVKSKAASEKSTLRFVLGFARYSMDRGLDAPSDENQDDSSRSDVTTDRMPSLAVGQIGNTRVFDRLFPDVYAPPIVEWALVMLSLALDNFGGPLSRERGTRSEQLARRQALAERVATIPLFLKTILLIEDGDTRNRLLELSIVRRALLCSTTVDRGWIVGMLKKSGTPSLRCVDYFIMVSKLDVSDYIGKDRGPRQADFTSFQREQRALFDAIQKFDEILPSLLILPKKDLEQVSRSRLVWQLLNETISRPFVIGIVMIDFVLHVTLMLAFRVDIGNYANKSGVFFVERDTLLLVLVIGLYQLLRKASEGIYLFLISPAVCWSYFLDFWTIVDLLSISLVWVGVSYLDNPDVGPLSNLMAISMALLWLRLIGLLKAINMHLATFVLSITEIMKDIKWYLLLMAICIIMFADMIHIITSNSNNGEYCEIDFDEEETRTREDFCSKNLLHGYLRMYAVLAGDFQFDDFRTTPFITFLFVLFILLGVIVLLNVLIAIVSDSYEKSLVRSAYLFGRARVGFAAEHAALESFLMRPRKRTNLSDLSIGSTTQFLLICGRIGRWSILLSLVGTAIATDMFLVNLLVEAPTVETGAHTGILVVVFILASILNIAVLDVIRFLFRGCCCSVLHLFFSPCQRNSSSGHGLHQKVIGLLSKVLDRCLSFIARKLFDINLKQEEDDDDALVEWEGRLAYINQHTSRIVHQSERHINEKVKESEKRIREYDRGTKEELHRDISNVLKAVVQNR